MLKKPISHCTVLFLVATIKNMLTFIENNIQNIFKRLKDSIANTVAKYFYLQVYESKLP